MSTTNNLPTRQQLEEIDALLKRMLSLPPLAVETRDDPSSVTPVPSGLNSAPAAASPTAYAEPRIQSWRVEWPTPAPTTATSATPTPPAATVAAWGSPVTPVPASPAPTTPRFNVYAPPVTPPAAAPVPYASPPFSPAYPPGYAPQDYPQKSVPAVLPGPSVITPQPAATQAVEAPGRSPLLFPVVLLNWVYDILTHLLPMGSWWRTGGRVWMGRAGVVMILAAIGWAVGEWQGIDWPKPDLSKINLSRFDWAK